MAKQGSTYRRSFRDVIRIIESQRREGSESAEVPCGAAVDGFDADDGDDDFFRYTTLRTVARQRFLMFAPEAQP